MFGRDVMRLLKNYGICSEKMYPYGLIEHKDEIPVDPIEEVADKHITSKL